MKVVHNRVHDFLPLGDEAVVLVADDACLAGAFVGKNVPTTLKGIYTYLGLEFFLAAVIAASDDDSGSALI